MLIVRFQIGKSPGPAANKSVTSMVAAHFNRSIFNDQLHETSNLQLTPGSLIPKDYPLVKFA